MTPEDAPLPLKRPLSKPALKVVSDLPSPTEAPRDAASAETVDLAYRLFLGRPPEAGRAAAICRKGLSVEELRQMLLRSREFARLYDKVPKPALPRVAPRPAPRPAGTPTLVHLHIPKTAGTSLNKMLLRLYAPEERMDAHGGDLTRRLRDMDLEERARLRLLAGHCVYGVDAMLSPPALYLCILRHPGERLLSYYRFIMRTKTPPHLEALVARKPDFGTFLMLGAETPGLGAELDNGQVRRISGKMWATEMTQEIYDETLDVIESDRMIYGLTERFDIFLDTLRDRGLLDDVAAEHANTAPTRVDFSAIRDALTPEQDALLSAFTHWDDKLYAHCSAALEARHPSAGPTSGTLP